MGSVSIITGFMFFHNRRYAFYLDPGTGPNLDRLAPLRALKPLLAFMFVSQTAIASQEYDLRGPPPRGANAQHGLDQLLLTRLRFRGSHK